MTGPAPREIREAAEAGTRLTLLLQDPSGQVPANGRTDDHVWVDVGYQLAFEVMAERSRSDSWLAGQFRHAAMFSFQNIARWRRTDGPWAGSYFVTKNHFDPALRVGYQPASQYSNYNGSLMFHLAEAYHARARKSKNGRRLPKSAATLWRWTSSLRLPSPMPGACRCRSICADRRPSTHENRWSPLGVVRFARAGWETRLGPSDGALTDSDGGVSFAPAFLENGRWLRLASLSARYEGVWSVEFVHPLLVRCAVDYRPKKGESGPTFRNEFTLTPDGVFSVVRKTSQDAVKWGVTWPLLEDDGRPLVGAQAAYAASTGYAGSADRQNFLAIASSVPELTGEPTLRSTFGDLRPVRVVMSGTLNRTFVYPASAGDPAPDSVRRSFQVTSTGFHSLLGRVSGNLYVGRTSAGGVGTEIDLDGDGQPDVRLSRECGFLLQLDRGKVIAIETDRAVTAAVRGRKVTLDAHLPLVLLPSMADGLHP